ncbi:MAG: hypothetical protein JW940_12650 [Polyangiaceae bacterium]|nr:hypothetical protein [Polyangiaceae bacterium]
MHERRMRSCRSEAHADLFPAHVLRQVSVEAEADPRTVIRVARGFAVRGAVADRVRSVLARHAIPTPGPVRHIAATSLQSEARR